MQKTVRTSQPKVARSGFSQSAQVLPKLKGYVSLRSLASHPPIRNTQSRKKRVLDGNAHWCPPKRQRSHSIPAERTAHWGIFSQSKAKDFRMCYFGFIATKKPAVRLRRPHTGRREMTSKPCKNLKKDGAPCRGSGFDQLDGYCIANTPAPSCPPPPVCRHAPKTFSQSLVNSRQSLV